MKWIYFKTALILSAAMLSLLVFLGYETYHSSIERNAEDLSEVLANVEENLKKERHQEQIRKADQEAKLDQRLQQVAVLLGKNDENIPQLLSWLSELIEAKEISLLDENNQVIFSSISNNQGHVYQTMEESDKAFSITTEESTLIIRKQVEHALFDTIYIEIGRDKTGVSDLEEQAASVLANASTDFHTIIAAVHKENGKILGMTENNTEEVELKKALSDEQRLAFVEKHADRGWFITETKESSCLMKITSYETMYLAAVRDIGRVGEQVLNQMIKVIFLLVILCLSVIFCLYLLLKKNLFDDLKKINGKINMIMEGDYSVTFDACRLKELQPTILAIDAFRQSFIHKDKRMNHLFGSISPYLAAFECLELEGGSFYSETLWSILNIPQDDQAYFLSHPQQFRSFLKELAAARKENGVILYQGKYLAVHTYEVDDDLIGVIIDQTREETAKKQLALSLENEKKKHHRDDLTKLLSRSSFKAETEKLLDREEKGVMLLLDLDHFKAVNDHLGHPQGDYVLCLFADCLKTEFRSSDLIGRLGGDEFVVFLPKDLHDAVLKAKLDHLMAKMQAVFSPYAQYRLSVSIGACRIAKEKGISAYESLYEGADSALYIAKRLGKNRYYINPDGTRCMVSTCRYCRKECSRREILRLDIEKKEDK